MTSRTKWLLGAGVALGAAAGVSLLWRYAARRRKLPCPAWASGVIIHPFSHLIPPSLDKLELEPGMRVLDVGCGPGRLSIPIAQAVGAEGEVVALDLQPGMLRRLEARAARAGVTNIQPVLADITRAPIEPAAFDRAILVTVLGEIPDREAALQSIYDALKPGGLLSITEILPDPHYQTRNTVRRLARAARFELRREYDGWMTFTQNFVKPAR